MSNKSRRVLFGLAALLLTPAAYLLLSWGPKEDAPELKKGSPAGQTEAQTMENITLEGVTRTGARWVLRAARARADQSGEMGYMTDVRYEYYGKSGKSGGTAARAEKRTAGEGYTLSGGVVADWGEWVARSPSANYDPAEGRMSGEEAVEVTSGGARLTGRGFEVDLNESRGRVLADSRALLKGISP